MEHTIKVDIRQLPAITSNFTETKARIGSYLKEFEFLVTEDDCKFAKEKATELNKLADTLDTLRKDKIKEISAPIAAFDAEAKAIHGMIKQTRQSLVDQYVKFELKTKEKLCAILSNEVKNLWKLHGVEKEFQRAIFDDLIILSNVTSTGRLTKKADDALVARVMQDKRLQDTITARLLVLEGTSLKAGLKAPLERHNVAHFLFSDDYDNQLQNLINSELKRQQDTERRIAEQIQAKAQQEIDALKAQMDKERIDAQKKAQEELVKAISEAKKPQQQSSQPVNIIDGDMKYSVTVTMEFNSKDMDVEKLKEATMRKFEKAGFKSVASVNIEKVAIGRPQTKSVSTDKLMVADGSLF
jgi:hypothetical protein